MSDLPRDPDLDELPADLDVDHPLHIAGVDESGELVTGVIWPDHVASAKADVRRLRDGE
jgi:hypothetical protein